MADFNYVHQIKDIEANSYNITDQRLYSDDKDSTTYKNIQLTTPESGSEPDLMVRGDVYINNVSENAAHKLLWQVSSPTDIADGVVVESKIASSAVTRDKIANGAINEAKLDTYAVTANKIANTAVTETKIGDGAVTSSKIASEAVTFAKLDSTAYVVEQDPISPSFSSAYRVLVSPDTNDASFVGATSKATGIKYNPSTNVLDVENLKVVAGEIQTSKVYNQGDVEISSDGNILISGSNVSISSDTQITIPGYATESWVSAQNYLSSADLVSYATTSYVDNRVVANPTDAAAVQLSKIKVGSSVFFIPEGGGGGGGTSNYAELSNKPQINGFELVGNVITSQILSAGSGISISGSIISATAIYTAGSHISISNNNVISATYEPATTVNLGLIKLGSDTVQTTSANSVTSDAGRTYAVQSDGSGQAVVNVPFSMPSSVSTALIEPDQNDVLSIFAETGNITIQTMDQDDNTEGLSFSGAEIYHIVNGQQSIAELTDTKDTAGAT